jgi:DNA-binding MarR family transcriptional regulator
MAMSPYLTAIRAWVRLDAALAAFNRDLHAEHGVTGLQLAVLRIVAERSPHRLKDLRRGLTLHPATLGQAVDDLVRRGLLVREVDPADTRGRIVAVTDAGRALLATAPLAGPVRLRAVGPDIPPERLAHLAAAFEDAVELFGLEPWAPPAIGGAGDRELGGGRPHGRDDADG